MIVGSKRPLELGKKYIGIIEHPIQPFIILKQVTFEDYRKDHEERIGLIKYPEILINDYFYEISTD